MGRPKKIISKRQKLRLNAKDIAVRAAKTFLQTFLASAGTILTLTSKEEQQAALIALVASSGASALSIVQNGLLAIADK